MHAYIVDDDVGFRCSLADLLTLEGWQVRCFETTRRFMSELDQTVPGVILLDLRMPEQTGLDLLNDAADSLSPHAVIMLTGHGDVKSAVQALKAGAVDFLEKPFASGDLSIAMAKAQSILARKLYTTSVKMRIAMLSARETEVLRALLDGHSNKVIAGSLEISPRTVEMHRARLLKKLRVRSTAEAVRLASIADFGNAALSHPPAHN